MPKRRFILKAAIALALMSPISGGLARAETSPAAAVDVLLSTNALLQTPPPITKPPAQPNTAFLPLGILAFDSENKQFHAKSGETNINFAFNLTNISPAEIIVTDVKGSCFCTVAQLPVTLPWKVPPGGGGPLPFTMDLVGKSGVLMKTVTIFTDKGMKMLNVRVDIAPPPPQAMSASDREKNQALAKADRQAVFKGECAKCHLEPVIGKFGKDLYVAACGICHEGEHRATMVPDLHNLPHPTNAEYWKAMTALGKPGTLMPAFSQTEGGPLSEAQLKSLADYLAKNIPSKNTNAPVGAKTLPKI